VPGAALAARVAAGGVLDGAVQEVVVRCAFIRKATPSSKSRAPGNAPGETKPQCHLPSRTVFAPAARMRSAMVRMPSGAPEHTELRWLACIGSRNVSSDCRLGAQNMYAKCRVSAADTCFTKTAKIHRIYRRRAGAPS
tara:strand:- start:820 stop:1233 length:414 start_codon:yes stop_codon:yes gene_type:complete